MKYCSHCGAEIMDEAVVCVKCGCSVGSAAAAKQSGENDTMKTVIKVFMIIGCVSVGWLLIPLAWCIPMTVKVFKAYNNNTPLSTGFKVCSLLFVSLIAGILMLCMKED